MKHSDKKETKTLFSEFQKKLQEDDKVLSQQRTQRKKLLKNLRDEVSAEHTRLQKKLTELNKDNDNQKNKILELNESVVNLQEERKDLSNKIHVYEQKNCEMEVKHNLISSLLSESSKSEGLMEYNSALYNDFLDFANNEGSLNNEAEAIIKLQDIEKELEVISAYPDFYSKRSVAIAGGFSAGKSEFISSMFADSQIRLPIGIEPTTAIPTYVLNGKSRTGVWGYSNLGGMIDLLSIDPDFHSKLSHNFISSFGFNLKSIMPFILLSTETDYEHLCFVDTPGYNPSKAQGGFQAEDMKTALEFVHNADALIWLIGMDAHGTISSSDLGFLEEVSRNNNRPLYLVLNKADLKPQSQLEDIMEEVIDQLDDFDIEFSGICAYSSIQKVEFLYEKESLNDFLSKIDSPSNKQNSLLEKLFEVDNDYQQAILKDIKQQSQVASVLNALKLDLLEEGFDDLGHEIFTKITKLSAVLPSNKKYYDQLKSLGMAIVKMADAIDQIFGQDRGQTRVELALDDIIMEDRFYSLTRRDEFENDLEEDSE